MQRLFILNIDFHKSTLETENIHRSYTHLFTLFTLLWDIWTLEPMDHSPSLPCEPPTDTIIPNIDTKNAFRMHGNFFKFKWIKSIRINAEWIIFCYLKSNMIDNCLNYVQEILLNINILYTYILEQNGSSKQQHV